MGIRPEVFGLVPDPQPVELLIERDHAFKKKPKRRDEKKDKDVQPPGCATCGRAKLHRDHLEVPSMNDGGSGMDRMAYQELKKTWMRALVVELADSDLPRGLQSVHVEVQIGFDQYRGRDEGNHRWMIEKALGDVLVEGFSDDDLVVPGGWLSEDTFWPSRRYSMGNIEGVHTPKEAWVRFMIFPSMVPPTPAPRSG